MAYRQTFGVSTQSPAWNCVPIEEIEPDFSPPHNSTDIFFVQSSERIALHLSMSSLGGDLKSDAVHTIR